MDILFVFIILALVFALFGLIGVVSRLEGK
jgi:hypothetical protein